MWYIYTREYYSPIKKKEILPFAPTGRDLDGIWVFKLGSRHEKQHSTVVKHLGSKGRWTWVPVLSSATDQLCDLGQVT